MTDFALKIGYCFQWWSTRYATSHGEVEVRFIAFPVGGHWPNDPIHTRDVYRRWIDWIEEHFDRRANPWKGSDTPIQRNVYE